VGPWVESSFPACSGGPRCDRDEAVVDTREVTRFFDFSELRAICVRAVPLDVLVSFFSFLRGARPSSWRCTQRPIANPQYQAPSLLCPWGAGVAPGFLILSAVLLFCGAASFFRGRLFSFLTTCFAVFFLVQFQVVFTVRLAFSFDGRLGMVACPAHSVH